MVLYALGAIHMIKTYKAVKKEFDQWKFQLDQHINEYEMENAVYRENLMQEAEEARQRRAENDRKFEELKNRTLDEWHEWYLEKKEA